MYVADFSRGLLSIGIITQAKNIIEQRKFPDLQQILPSHATMVQDQNSRKAYNSDAHTVMP